LRSSSESKKPASRGDRNPKAGTAGLQIALTTADCRADYDALKRRGVAFDIPGYEDVQKAPWGTSAYFRDPDGNAWAIVQQSWIGKIMVRRFGRRKQDVALERTTHVPIVVKDQEKAIEFYVGKLGCEKRQDYALKGRPRWLTVAPAGATTEFVLLQGEFVVDARGEAGHRFTLTTEDCRGEVARLKGKGVRFTEPAPAETPFGLLAAFDDPDGNHFALLQPAGPRARNGP
jgi:predicted enzyme related to lactoylglutathione lyase